MKEETKSTMTNVEKNDYITILEAKGSGLFSSKYTGRSGLLPREFLPAIFKDRRELTVQIDEFEKLMPNLQDIVNINNVPNYVDV